MIRTRRRARGVPIVLLALAAAVSLTVRAPPASAVLSVTPTDVTFLPVTLDGVDQSNVATAGVWTIVDLRLGGLPWTVSISATAPTTAAGSVETTPHALPVGNLSVSTGSITAEVGSDPPDNITGSTDLQLSTGPQTLVVSTGDSVGTYLFTPTFTIQIPANAYRSNYSGAVGSSPLNPYKSTLTVTIA